MRGMPLTASNDRKNDISRCRLRGIGRSVGTTSHDASIGGREEEEKI
ncbi:hypothetical protein JMJ77_0008253 [Colletotrichum scovillei]|uniref:Uncharacterized protein n=1 Tax=Colletotrichum scovillei TaxID=1209932 RepID=A0A9P7RDU1_9PEZI|nr:hypothetical protein JMJ77_0008253 [Colletotrichum scovillei]KAG7075244.1 hypothetical protein JMJ76_0011705 [Colletotrichum scovillei]KAG7082239.1 hypothetical protein JMJ78_0004342 [Colletotrichum scovillei]